MKAVRPTQLIKRAASKPLHRYADWRVGATDQERACYKQTDSILLSFDDYGSPKQVAELLALLRDKKIKAAFFLQGDWAEAQPRLVVDIASEGHIIGNHTLSHAILTKLSEQEIKHEIKGGLPGPWFRPPEGRYNAKIRKIAARLGYSICYWSVDSRDWTGASVTDMRHTILSELHPGAVVLFHIHGKHTLELLPELIDEIRARGYELTTHSESWLPS